MTRLSIRIRGASVSERSKAESFDLLSISVCTKLEGFFVSLMISHCNLFTDILSLLINPE